MTRYNYRNNVNFNTFGDIAGGAMFMYGNMLLYKLPVPVSISTGDSTCSFNALIVDSGEDLPDSTEPVVATTVEEEFITINDTANVIPVARVDVYTNH